MARTKTVPNSKQVLPYIDKFLPYIIQPNGATGNAWRTFVRSQPMMLNCRDLLAMQLTNLDWKISARNTDRTEELADEIDYYTTDVLNKWNDEDYDTGIERCVDDLTSTPFGAIVEIGRYLDGSVAWVRNMDSATCYPTTDPEYPVVQNFFGPGYGGYGVSFPKELVARSYISPLTEWDRQGWGMAPPEKIFIAAQMIAAGDSYYWRLLMDTPQTGLLDLVDMEEESAKKWIESYREMMAGTDPQKIPVLYGHEKLASFISFGLNPAEIQMDKGLAWYAALVSGGYGIPLSELGLSFNNTLAGQIREDRRSRRTGFGLILTKITNLINKFLPRHLMFQYIYRDEEGLNLLGRARATSMTAFNHSIDKGVLTLEAVRAQLLIDGLIDAGPAEMSKNAQPPQAAGSELRNDVKNDAREVTPDEGGHGVVKQVTEKAIAAIFPLLQTAKREGCIGDVVEFGRLVARDIISDSRIILRADFMQEQSEDARIMAAIAARELSAPWAQKYLSHAHPKVIRGTPVYNRIKAYAWQLHQP